MSLRLFSWLFLVLPAVLLVACDSTPTAPSPTVSVEESGQRPSLGCATDLELFINNLGPTPVPFSGPTLQSLGEVDKSSCTPVSGSDFPLGTTPVTCSATEADDLVQSCSFSVTVLARLLGETGFLAFGDSITTGVFSPDLALALATSAGIPTSYPAQLEALLMGRYPDQPISVINSGKPGEKTRDGKQRLPGVLDQVRPDVVMILEGINELSFVGPPQTAADIDSMVRSAQSRGVDVLLATLTPVGPVKAARRPGITALVDDVNRRIRQIAVTRNAALVDIHAAMVGNLSLLGDDGLHLSTAGYQVMSEEFVDAIVSLYEKVEGR